jgi:hypothetical protein
MKFSFVLCALALLLSAGCSYRDLKNGTQATQTFGQSGANLGFAQIQAAVLGPKCARCHGAMVASYEAVKNLSQDIQARVGSSDANFVMPPPNAVPLTTEERNLLLAWIGAGSPRDPTQPNPANPSPPGNPPAPGNPSPPPGPAPTPRLSFANLSATVFQPKCARCHSGMMGSYESVVANLQEIEMRVRSTFDFEKMPPARAPQLTTEELNLLLDWIQAGAPREGNATPPPGRPQPPSQPPAPPAPLPPCEDSRAKNGDDDHCEDDFINQTERNL